MFQCLGFFLKTISIQFFSYLIHKENKIWYTSSYNNFKINLDGNDVRISKKLDFGIANKKKQL